MFKYTEKFKTKVVKQYVGGTLGFKLTAARHGIPAPTLRRWVRAYLAHGKGGLDVKRERYSSTFKLSVLQHMWENGLSKNQVAAIFNIRNPFNVSLWERRYRENGVEGLARTSRPKPMPMKAPSKKPDNKPDDELSREELLKRLDYLRMENEVLKKAASLNSSAKSDRDTKAQIVHELRQKYPVRALLQIVSLPKSTFYYWDTVRQTKDKYADTNHRIKANFVLHRGLYGYRRIALVLKNEGVQLHENTVFRLMGKLGLKSVQRQKKYKSYRGDLGETAANILERDFVATAPHEKWATDITEFKVGPEKLYLSPIKDMFNGEIIAYSIGRRPTFELVVTMLKKGLRKLAYGENPILHSDQGWHYRMSNYCKSLRDKGIVQSMSRKGNCLDNASMESFFGVLKSECFHLRKFANIDELKTEIDSYIKYYNEVRIKTSLNGMSPVQYRIQHAKAS